MKRALLSAVLATAIASPVFAADFAEAPVASLYDWSGFYIGAHIGGGSSDVEWDYVGGGTADHSGSGVLGGVQAGYNFQAGNWVLGIEADVSAAGIDGDTPCPNPAFSCESEIDWLGTARLRAGYAFDRILVYGTGGFGFGHTTIQTVHPVVGVNGTSETLTGWSAGAGAEFAFGSNWSVKAEYMYYDLGSETYTVDAGLLVNADVQIHTGKIGLNFRW